MQGVTRCSDNKNSQGLWSARSRSQLSVFLLLYVLIIWVCNHHHHDNGDVNNSDNSYQRVSSYYCVFYVYYLFP